MKKKVDYSKCAHCGKSFTKKDDLSAYKGHVVHLTCYPNFARPKKELVN